MAKTIALLQQKGGSGKTTTCVNLACGLQEEGYKVAVVDMDKDKPDAWSWLSEHPTLGEHVFRVDEKQAREQISDIKQKYDFVVIDTPPNFQTAALKAALLADLVVIPAAPSGMDLSGLLEAKDLAMTADKPYRLLGNRIIQNTNLAQSLKDVLTEEGFALQTFIPQSVKFVEAESQGAYIGDYAKHSLPHIRVQKVVAELLDFFSANKTEMPKSRASV